MSQTLPADPASALLVVAHEALYLTDLEGNICYWSPSAEQMFGFDAERALGSDACALLCTDDDQTVARSAVEEAAGTGYAFAELGRRTAAGGQLVTRVSLRRVDEQDGAWLAVSEQDLTDIQRAEQQLFQELQRSETARELFRNVLDSARDIGIVAVEADGSISLWSSGAERLFACRRADICGPDGARLLEGLTMPDAVPLPRAFQLASEQGSYEADFQACTKGKRPFSASISARPRFNRYGEPDGVIAVIQDLTLRMETLIERDEALKEARAAREAALSAAKTKSEFLANMSHEIRTPMNAVLGMLQLMMRTDLNRKQLDYAGKAESAARDLLHIIDDILDFSKIEAGRLSLEQQPFALGSLLKDVGVILGANIGDKSVEVLFKVDPALPEAIVGDVHRLKQVLINLSGNALKFTETGEVVLSVDAVRDSRDREAVRFSVRDTGIGMTPTQQERLFKAFSQADAGTTRRFGGTGLGLVICQRLVRLMGGDIALHSEAGVGSTFSFEIPLEAAEPSSLPGSRRQGGRDLGDLRVLIVDDNEMAREIIAELAKSLGWRTTVAASGGEALQCVQQALESGESFDIAFVDWAMPGLDGWETIRMMKNLDGQRVLSTAVIMVTAHSREAMEHQRGNEKDLVADFLVKPVTASDLFEAVVNCLDGGESPVHEPTGGEKRLQGLCVLVVEDNPNNQQIAIELLEYEGADVVLAANGEEGVEAVRADPDRYDVVLMDVQMPVMDGYTATRKIRAELKIKDLPIVAMTANVMQADRDASAEAGMNAHIGKPYDVETVVQTLRDLCGRVPIAAAADGTATQDEVLPGSPQGFDFASAFGRLGRNAGLYASQARSFAARVEIDLERIRELLNAGDIDAAKRDLHTLKGLSATLGAMALANQFKVIERQVHEDASDNAAMDQQWGVARALGKEAVTELLALASTLEETVAGATDKAMPSPAPDHLTDLIAELEELIEQSNMRALEVFSQLRSLAAEKHPRPVAALGAALESLDFPAAAQPLRELKMALS